MKPDPSSRIVIDLSNPDSNPNLLIALARQAARQVGASDVELANMTDALRSSETYAELLDRIEANLPYVFKFMNDPRIE